MPLFHIILGILACFFWSNDYMAYKILFKSLSPLLIVSLETGTIGIFTLVFFRNFLFKINFKIKDILPISTIWAIADILYVYGVKFGVELNIVAIGNALIMIFIILFSVFLCKEKIKWNAYIGIAIAIMGLFVAFKIPAISENLRAFEMVLLSSFLWSLNHALIKKKKYTRINCSYFLDYFISKSTNFCCFIFFRRLEQFTKYFFK